MSCIKLRVYFISYHMYASSAVEEKINILSIMQITRVWINRTIWLKYLITLGSQLQNEKFQTKRVKLSHFSEWYNWRTCWNLWTRSWMPGWQIADGLNLSRQTWRTNSTGRTLWKRVCSFSVSWSATSSGKCSIFCSCWSSSEKSVHWSATTVIWRRQKSANSKAGYKKT